MLTYDEATALRDGIHQLKESWIWNRVLNPYFESQAQAHLSLAIAPGPDDASHASARYRLAELHDFQRFLANSLANAEFYAGQGDLSKGDPGPNEEVRAPFDPSNETT